MDNTPIITPQEQSQARNAAMMLRTELSAVGSFPQSERDAFLAKVAMLESDITAARRTISDLMADIEELRSELQRLFAAPCDDGQARVNGACPPPLPTCGDKEMLSGRVCVCVDGYQRNAATRMCELPPCDDGQERVNGECPPVALPTCGDNERFSGHACVCIPPYERNSDGGCEFPPCRDGQERVRGVCPPPLPTCGDKEMLSGRVCVCSPPLVRNPDGVCASKFDTAEYRMNVPLALTEASYAYERGYFGQGVVIGSWESVNAMHEEFAGRVVPPEKYPDDRYNRIRHVNPYNSGHGTRGFGVAAAAMNGLGGHGVAPSATIAPRLGQSHAVEETFSDVVQLLTVQFIIVAIGNFDPDGVARTGDTAVVFTNTTFIDIATRSFNRLSSISAVEVRGAGNNGQCCNDYQTIPQPHLSSWVPLRYPQVEEKLLVATSVNNDSKILRAPNGRIARNVCGVAMRYCVAGYETWDIAPTHGGNAVYSTSYIAPGGQPIKGHSGTSAAAAYIAGVLAVLKSAAPELPPTMIRQILLTSAIDAGAEGIDDEYGWGIAHVGNGIRHIENMKTKNGILLRDLRNGLPAEFSHLRGRLSDVSVALKITDNSYWNMPLTAVLTNANSQASLANAGVSETAAKEIMAAEYAPGESFRFWGGVDIDANGASQFIGEGGGVFGAASSDDTTGFMKWTTADYNGVSGFGEFVYTDIDADYNGEGLVSKVDGAFGEEWKAGLEWRDVFRFGDRARFSVRQQKRIGGGEMVLHYPVADGDSHAAFIGETPQTIRMETARIPLKEKRTLIYGVGYSGKIRRWIPAFAGMTKGGGMAGIFGGGMAKGRDSIFAGMIKGGEWSAAAEFNSQTNAAAFWAGMELEF